MRVPSPPDPFDCEVAELAPGDLLYRVGSITRGIGEFNPGRGPATRFGFFGDPPVPLLYAAGTPQGALAESLLHDVPVSGGLLLPSAYQRVVMGRLRITAPLRLARLRGLGLRRLGVEARQLTDTPASAYPRTVAWAEAAHRAGLDGLEWTARLCDDTPAVVLFGDRAADAVELDTTFGRYFSSGPGLDWLIDTCAVLRVEVLPPR